MQEEEQTFRTNPAEPADLVPGRQNGGFDRRQPSRLDVDPSSAMRTEFHKSRTICVPQSFLRPPSASVCSARSRLSHRSASSLHPDSAVPCTHTSKVCIRCIRSAELKPTYLQVSSPSHTFMTSSLGTRCCGWNPASDPCDVDFSISSHPFPPAPSPPNAIVQPACKHRRVLECVPRSKMSRMTSTLSMRML